LNWIDWQETHLHTRTFTEKPCGRSKLGDPPQDRSGFRLTLASVRDKPVNDDPNKTSTFAALRNPLYRKLWLAVLLSGTCVAAHDTAATWTMNMLGSSAFLLSLMSTVASLPFFLFTPPAGVLADMVDRRKLLCFINLWLAGAAGLLSMLGSFHLLNPYVLLFSVFLIGAGFAFHSPLGPQLFRTWLPTKSCLPLRPLVDCS
jgi:hypothetical protein